MPAGATLHVLYVTDSWDAPCRYRCLHAAAQLRTAGAVANVLHVDDPTLPDALQRYGLVVLFRLPWDARVASLVRQRAGAPLVFDCDDLVFDPAAATLLPFLDDLPEVQRQEYGALFPRLRRTLDACDAFVGSTERLARVAAGLGKPAFVHPNLVHPAYERIARRVRMLARRPPSVPVIAYLSGSNTHDRDLASIGGALARVLATHPTARLLLCGFVHVPQPLLPFAARIDRLPYLHWRVYPWALARCRVTVAPAAVVNDFSDGKSPLKFFEAGAVGVPTVATPTAGFRDAIVDGENGLLASSEEEWGDTLGRALDPAAALALGEAARATIAARFSFAAHVGRLGALLEPLAGAPTGPIPVAQSLDPDRRASSPSTRQRLRAKAQRARERLLLAGDRPRALAANRGDAAVGDVASIRDPVPFASLLATVAEHGPEAVREDGPVLHTLVEDTHGWERWTPIGDLLRAPGDTFTSQGPDPGLEGPGLAVRTADFRYLVLRMTATVGVRDTRAQLFWSPPGASGFADDLSCEWPVVADGREHTYVIDLAGGAWERVGTVTRFRLDPLDCAGVVTLGQMLLVADLAQLEPSGDVRGAFARHYLAGRGLECGALQNPLRPPAGVQILYIDRLTETDARRHYPELDGWPLVSPHLVGDLHHLPIATGSLDFCIGNHLLEHARDPIGSLEEMLRVVRPGGVLVVSVPDVHNPIDSRRPVTPFEHLLDDHNPALDRRAEDHAHFFDATASGHPHLAREETIACVESVLRHATGDWRLVLIDDASTDAALVSWLDQLAAEYAHWRLGTSLPWGEPGDTAGTIARGRAGAFLRLATTLARVSEVRALAHLPAYAVARTVCYARGVREGAARFGARGHP